MRGFRFGQFHLDLDDRRLAHDAGPIELSARYFDALALLVGEAGRLVTKDRFHDEVWRGVPVTDDALTQCIKALRRALGDDAARPRFIATVPKHGYRFIAAVHPCGETVTIPAPPTPAAGADSGARWGEIARSGGAGTLGAGLAGLIGGLFYGFAATQPNPSGAGGASTLLVMLWLTMTVALVGGAAVSFGIAAAARLYGRVWAIAGGALGGMIVGGVVKLLGLDAFLLLLGRSPDRITGAPEGLLLGAAVGAGAWLMLRRGAGAALPPTLARTALIGGAGALLILSLGGRMMGGSLDQFARSFPASQLRLDALGALLGEPGFGPVTAMATAALEGALFACGIVGAMLIDQRRPVD